MSDHLTSLELGDDALLAAQRLAEWASRAPTMEEDVALANIALDQLGAARLFLSLAGESLGRDEDELAYLRDADGFRNGQLVELPNGPGRGDLDFGWTIAKLLLLSAAQLQTYERLAAQGGPLGEIAAKTVKESAYHFDHARLWTVRLGGGTTESHDRMQEAVRRLWPFTYDICEDRRAWSEAVTKVLREATLEVPEDSGRREGGRGGSHTEHLSYLLGEMQVLHRAHPGGEMVALDEVVGSVLDPELRVVTIAELGILRSVTDGERVRVEITPTYAGCPAMDTIREDIRAALHEAGRDDVDIRTVLSPPWSTDMITPDGRAALKRAGIAPPSTGGTVALSIAPLCPRCGSGRTEEISRFGPTACQSLWRCQACQEPFDHVRRF